MQLMNMQQGRDSLRYILAKKSHVWRFARGWLKINKNHPKLHNMKHLIRHNMEVFKCLRSDCKATFVLSSQLQEDEEAHDGMRRYQCQQSVESGAGWRVTSGCTSRRCTRFVSAIGDCVLRVSTWANPAGCIGAVLSETRSNPFCQESSPNGTCATRSWFTKFCNTHLHNRA
jgi:hypothetical protein